MWNTLFLLFRGFWRLILTSEVVKRKRIKCQDSRNSHTPTVYNAYSHISWHFCHYFYPISAGISVNSGPRVVVSTAAFHARVRGSVPGLGGLKETKLFLPHPRVKVSIVGSLRDREVACSASDRQGSNFESCVWRTVSSQSSHHPQEVLLAQFSLYVHKGGLKPDSFHLSQSILNRFSRNFAGTISWYHGNCPVNMTKVDEVLQKLFMRLMWNLLVYFQKLFILTQFMRQFSTVYHVISQAPSAGITANAL